VSEGDAISSWDYTLTPAHSAFGIMLMRVAYGFDDNAHNKSLIRDAQFLSDVIAESTVPGRFLVNIFPILKKVPEWIPGAGFQKYLREMAQLSLNVLNAPYDAAKKDAVGQPSG